MFEIDREKLDQFTQFRFSSLTEEGWNKIEECVQYQDDLWEEPSPSMNVSSIFEAIQPTLTGHLKRACKQISFLETPTREVGLKNPYLICDYCGGSHEADESDQNNPSEQVCLSGGDIYNDHSLLRFYQNNDTSSLGNSEPLPRPATDNFTEGETENEGLEGAEPCIIQEPASRPSILYQPSRTSNPPFLSRLKKQKKDDEDERLLLIFKQIHINLPFLEAMIHMPKGSKVLKELLSHKEKLESATARAPYQTEPVEPLEWKAPKDRLKPSRMESLKLELKDLPEHLEYAFLQENNQLPVVISSTLSSDETTRLLEVLRNHKGVIAWSIADIKGIDSSFCTHIILMEDEFKPSV
ncbi:hypothetical protein Tco_0139163 [Tanacetum coccineum]